jgi:hypothetical protein
VGKLVFRSVARGQLSCHDIGVLMNGHRRLVVCAGEVATVHDISNPARPKFVTSFTTRGVTSWHSAALSWDGKVTVMGWEPGGGVAPECEAGDPDLNKSVFFFDTFSGELLATWVLPRPQSAVENCTIHNYNVVPTGKRDVLVMGNYQAGTWVVDFTNPRHARTVAWSDPPPLDPATLTLAGAWGSYWYNGFIYETNITEGLNIFRLHSRVTAGARRFPFLNPTVPNRTGPGALAPHRSVAGIGGWPASGPGCGTRRYRLGSRDASVTTGDRRALGPGRDAHLHARRPWSRPWPLRRYAGPDRPCRDGHVAGGRAGPGRRRHRHAAGDDGGLPRRGGWLLLLQPKQRRQTAPSPVGERIRTWYPTGADPGRPPMRSLEELSISLT